MVAASLPVVTIIKFDTLAVLAKHAMSAITPPELNFVSLSLQKKKAKSLYTTFA